MRRSLSLFAMVLALASGGCGNVVMSDAPLIGAESGAAVLRPGVWINADADCSGAEPPTDWSGCSQPVFVVAGGLVTLNPPETPSFQPIRLSAGRPIVAQAEVHGDRLTGRALDDFARVQQGKTAVGPADRPFFVYLLLEPEARDDQGRIVALRSAFLACGPDPRDVDQPVRPLPGLRTDEEGHNCLAVDQAGLMTAAGYTVRHRAKPDMDHYRWLRDLSPAEAAIVAAVSPPSPNR